MIRNRSFSVCGKGGSVDPGSDDPGFTVNLYMLNERLDKTYMYVARVVSFALEGRRMYVCRTSACT
jgi:hypothetical protein